MAREWARVLVVGEDVHHRLPTYNALVRALEKEGLKEKVLVWTTIGVAPDVDGHPIAFTVFARELEEPSEELIENFIACMKKHPLCS